MQKTKNVMPTFDIGSDYPGSYDAPVCGYLAKVDVPQGQCDEHKYPFNSGDTVLVFGDIAMMAGHCVLATKDGKIHFGWHTDYFRPLTEEEI
jgi:hypothetical protein